VGQMDASVFLQRGAELGPGLVFVSSEAGSRYVAFKTRSSCLMLLRAGITDVHHHAGFSASPLSCTSALWAAFCDFFRGAALGFALRA
jgi:hypothetical protein